MKVPKMLRQQTSPPSMSLDQASRMSPRDYQSHADSCRDSQKWTEAAYYYKLVLDHNGENVSIWIQRGNMLKEAGLLKHAEGCYRQAIVLEPANAEAFVQLAIVKKQQGKFQDAVSAYEGARQLGYKNVEFLDREEDFLKRTSDVSIASLFASSDVAPYRFFMSSVSTAPNETNANDLSSTLGKTHYSYGFILKGYAQAFDYLKIPYEFINSPEYIPDIRERSQSPLNIHIGIYPPDGPRLLKGAYNVFVFAWEFERLQHGYERISNHAFVDSKTMLSIADEVWGISEFTSKVARDAGLPQVRTVPTPLIEDVANNGRSELPARPAIYKIACALEHIKWRPLAMSPVMQSVLSEQSRQREQTLRRLLIENYDDGAPVFYLTILNVYDFRKQIKPLLEAFVRFSKQYLNVFLLIKLSVAQSGRDVDPNALLFGNQIADPSEISPPLVSDRVWITTDALSRNDINGLYDISAHYCSTSHGEGQNLPLLEAMGRGVVPVSVDHTAMADYITDGNAIVIPTTFAPLSMRLIDRYRIFGINTYYVSSKDMLKTLEHSRNCDVSSYSSKSHMAVKTVQEKFGPEAFRGSIDQLVRDLGATSDRWTQS